MRRKGVVVIVGMAQILAIVTARSIPRQNLRRPVPVATPQHVVAAGGGPQLRPAPALRTGASSEAAGLPRNTEERARIFVYTVRPAGCLETALSLAIEAKDTGFIKTMETTGVSCVEVPAGRDYFIFVHCYEHAGEGMIRHRVGRATVARLLGSAIVFIELTEAEVFEDRT